MSNDDQRDTLQDALCEIQRDESRDDRTPYKPPTARVLIARIECLLAYDVSEKTIEKLHKLLDYIHTGDPAATYTADQLNHVIE